ncbi:MAG TPA: hypothetical protein VNE00_05980 [Paraburkholderia sp.]|jgi:hypothetical protein|nr:hypothetical protein [Paraburkholderia sp.]
MPKRLMPAVSSWRRGHCRLALSHGAIAVLRVDTPWFGAARKTAPRVAQRLLPDFATAAPDQLAAQLAATLDEAGCKGLPVYATFDDELVRYFIVTPPQNGARMQDLRAAAGVRFQMLYGEPASDWQIVADWQASGPFVACAIAPRLHMALQLAVKAQRGCLVAAAPNFVAAWNRWHRRVSGDAWLATLHCRTLTIGLIAGAARRARIAAVRTLALPEERPSLAWLREQLERAALLDNVAPPAVLHVHGPQIAAWQQAPAGERGIAVRWCTTGHAAVPALALSSGASDGSSTLATGSTSTPSSGEAAASVAQSSALSALAQLAWSGAAP